MDEEDTGSPSSRGNGLTHILSNKNTRNRRRRDSSSLKSTESDGRGLRASLSDKIDRLKTGGEDGVSENSGLRKLLPKTRTAKRRQREQEEEQADREEAARGRSIAERGTLRSDTPEARLGTAEGDAPDESSLITYDSDIESPSEIRPPLSQHSSHAGYLTISSPLIHATTYSPPTSSEAQLDGSSRSNTLPSLVGTLITPESSPALVSKKLQPPSEEPRNRSTSPVGRLKEALSPRRTSTHDTSERRAEESGRATKDLDLDNTSRGNTAASKKGSTLSERQKTGTSRTAASPARPLPAKVKPINTDARPKTPPSGASDDNTPVIVNTPPTPTRAGIPPISSRSSINSNPNVVTSPSGNMISHRRVTSGSANTLGPSKLSNITSAPLTPNLDITPAPAPTPSSFFSSVFSAAQNAANTLSNSIGNTSVTPNRSRSGTQERRDIEDPKVETLGNKSGAEDTMEEKELAVRTLGTGDLHLSHLGISETSNGVTTPLSSRFHDDLKGRPEDALAKIATAPPGPFSDGMDSFATSEVDDIQSMIRPRSVYEASPIITGEQTPPNGSVSDGRGGVHRSGSIRSAIGTRRHRGSSTTTGTTIGAAIVAANASLAHPQASTTPKITGFAVASKKRNRDFHQLFRSVPDDDYLIEDYSCALQREILAHGRLYVSEGHLCFSSNIFGWVTTLVMSFDEIVSVEKRSTALVFKNGLMISTLHAKHIFASFTSRDSTYDLIVGIWKLGHPSLRSSLNGVTLDETGGDKTEKTDDLKEASQSGSGSEDESEEGDEVYDEDEDEEDGMSFTHAEGSVAGSETADKSVTRKPSNGLAISGMSPEKGKEESGASMIPDFPGPLTHGPTECTDQDSHYSKSLADEIVAAPLGKIYNLMFGPESLVWMRNWLVVEQKSLDLTMDDKKFLSSDNKIRTYSYIKPLNGAIGPKQTKCLSTETLDFMDLEKAVSVTIATQTPDVPSGNVFCTKTRYCLSWAEGNATRLQMGCTIEWTGKSWLKGPIEKGANDGQAQYARDIVASLRTAVSSRRPTAIHTGGKSKRKTRRNKESKNLSKNIDGASDSKQETKSWRVFEPLRPFVEPLLDIVVPLLGGNVAYIFIGILLIASWFRFGIFNRASVNPGDLGHGLFASTPARIAAYEEIWKKEESDLWNWLEDRVGIPRLRDVGDMQVERKVVAKKLKERRMDEREVDAAIRVTEEKLEVLKGVVGRRKDGVEDEKKKQNTEPGQADSVQEGTMG